MKKIKGKPEENSIEKFAIRSMSKARYLLIKKNILDWPLKIIHTLPHQ